MNKLFQIFKFTVVMTGFFIVNACGLFDNGSDDIIGNYKIQWIDMHSTRSICKTPDKYPTLSETLISEYVFAVGHNSDYIVAKQHPANGFESGYEVDTTITNYFILDMKSNTKDNRNRVIGPLTIDEFNKKVMNLNVDNIEFDQIYPENPY